MKNKKLILTISLLGIAFGKVSHAKDLVDNRWYIAPSLSYVWADEDRQTSRNNYGLGLGVGKALNEKFNVELSGFYNSREILTNKKTAYEWDAFGSTLDLQYYFNRNNLSPYAVIGAGVMDSRVAGTNALGFIGEVGLGVAYKINDNFSLRSDVRYRYNDNFERHITGNNSDSYDDAVVNVGLVIPFGSGSVKTVKATITPSKPVADLNSKDSDNDSVKNSLDKCPNTKPGVKVDNVGCDIEISLKGVDFNLNSPILTPKAKITLDNLAKEINSYPDKKDIEIQGHTSSDGNKEANVILSQARADSVFAYLLSKGVKNKMTAHGYGSTMPISDELTKEGRLKNRRVNLVWK